jgi:hypothetical protein
MEKPTFEVEVAKPEMFNPRSVVVPKPELDIEICDGLDVPNPVSGDDVPIDKESESDLNDQMLDEPSESANCGAVEEESCRRNLGVVVPTPIQLFVKIDERVVDVERSEPTAKLLDVVAIS